MKQLSHILLELKGYADKNERGLYNAGVGDCLEIGFEGTRAKWWAIIDKVVSKDRLQDKSGNIYDRDGMLFRNKNLPYKIKKGQKVSARRITKKEREKSIKSFVSKSIRDHEWEKESVDNLMSIGKVMNISWPQLEELK